MRNIFVKQIGIYVFLCENIQMAETAVFMVIFEVFKDTL